MELDGKRYTLVLTDSADSCTKCAFDLWDDNCLQEESMKCDGDQEGYWKEDQDA